MEEAKAKKSKSTKIIIILVIVLIAIIALGVGGYFAYMKLNSTGTEWGDTYYRYAKDLSGSINEISSLQEPEENSQSFKNGLPYGVKDDVKTEFVDIDNDNIPEMIATYSYKDYNGITIYYIKDNKVNYYPPQNGNDIILLYNIEKKDYKYYVHEYRESLKEHHYVPIEDLKKQDFSNSISFKDEEIESKLDVVDGEIPVLSKFDQTFIKIDEDKEQFDLKANMNEREIKENIKESVKDYKNIDEIITDEVKTGTENKVKEIETKKEEIKKAEEEKAAAEEAARKAEAMKITQSNVVEKLGEHLKYFSGCYLGRTYGIGTIYKLTDVTGKVNIPGTHPEYEMAYEVVGLSSISALNENFKKYISDDVVSKLRRSDDGDITADLHDYNGKVYWVRGGIGDGPEINYKKAKLLSSEGDTSTIQLENINVLGDILTERITVTVKYDEATSEFKITDYSVKEVN